MVRQFSRCIYQGSVIVLHVCIKFKDGLDHGCRASYYQVYVFKYICVMLTAERCWARNSLRLVVPSSSAKDIGRDGCEKLRLGIMYREHG